MRSLGFLVGALVVAFVSSPAFAEETTGKPAPKGPVVIKVVVTGRRQVPSVTIDLARMVPRIPLPELRRPLVDPNGVVLAEPF